MALPHHHVFNAIQSQIQEGVPMKKITPLLLENSIIKQSQAALAKKGGRNGMKIICGYIKNQTFDSFLKFVECLCKLISTDPECGKTVTPVLTSIVEVVKDFDDTNHTEHTKSIIAIIEQYQKPVEEEATVEEQETLVTEKLKSLTVHGAQAAGATSAAAMSQPIISSSVDPKLEHIKSIIEQYQKPVEEEATALERVEEQEALVTEKLKSLTVESPHGAQAAGATSAAVMPQPIISSSVDPKLGDVTIMLPDLPYVTKPEQATFNSRGGRYYNSDWDFAIDVPANAIPEDQEVTVKMGACAYGPFDIPDNYHVASGFICIVANKPFLEAVNLTLEHCLVFSDYQEDSSVVVLRSDHSLVSGMKFKFLPLPNTPEISPETPHLSFQLKDLCILCAASKNEGGHLGQPQSSDSNSTTTAQSTKQDPDVSMDTCSGQDANMLNVNLGKKRSRSTESIGPDKCRKRVEYVVLFFEPPLCRKTRPFNVLAFVCHNCIIAIKECRKQAEHKLDLCVIQPHNMEFNFGHTKYIKFSLEKEHTQEWIVSLKGQEWVSEDHINKLDLEEGVYPPCKVFEVCWSSATPPKRSLKIEARIHNVEQSFCDQNYLSYKITASAGGGCCSGCKNCWSQAVVTLDAERVQHQIERVNRDLSDSQKNQIAREDHFAAGASLVKNFHHLCRVLELSGGEVKRIEYDNRHCGDKELAYQALYRWMQMRRLTTVSSLAAVLATAGEFDAVRNLLKHCNDQE